MRILAFLFSGLLALGAQTPDLSGLLQQEALAYAQAQAAGLSGTVSIRVLRPPNLPRLPEGPVRFEPTHASKQDFTGPFFVTLRLFVNERPSGSVRVDLEGRWVGQLLRVRAALPRKAVPTEEQLEEVPFEGTPPPGALTEYPAGFQLKNPVAAGRILCRADLQRIPLIHIGDPVRLELVCGSMVVSSETVARTAGAQGDKIRLELPNSRRCLQAEITGPGEARILWTGPRG
jgi:flagella basal body P-ring formation protein FlgA